MEYIVFPTTDITEDVTVKMSELNLSPRKSINGDKVIMKISNYDMLFPPMMTLALLEDEEETREVTYPYPTYEGKELDTLLGTYEWNNKDNIL